MPRDYENERTVPGFIFHPKLTEDPPRLHVTTGTASDKWPSGRRTAVGKASSIEAGELSGHFPPCMGTVLNSLS